MEGHHAVLLMALNDMGFNLLDLAVVHCTVTTKDEEN